MTAEHNKYAVRVLVYNEVQWEGDIYTCDAGAAARQAYMNWVVGSHAHADAPRARVIVTPTLPEPRVFDCQLVQRVDVEMEEL